jgi:hypothetical protein
MSGSKGNGIGRTELHTDLAPFAFERIYCGARIAGSNRIELTHLPAGITALTFIGFNSSLESGIKIKGLPQIGLQQKVQVGRIHIQITDYSISGKMGKRRGQRGLAGASFSADHQYFTHDTPSRQ